MYHNIDKDRKLANGISKIIATCNRENRLLSGADDIKKFLQKNITDDKKIILDNFSFEIIENHLSFISKSWITKSQAVPITLKNSEEIIGLIEFIADHCITQNKQNYSIKKHFSFIYEVYYGVAKMYLDFDSSILKIYGEETSLKMAENYLQKYFRICEKELEEKNRNPRLVNYYGGMAKLSAKKQDWPRFEEYTIAANYYCIQMGNLLVGQMLQEAYQWSYIYTYKQGDWGRSLQYAKEALSLYAQLIRVMELVKLHNNKENPQLKEKLNNLSNYVKDFHIKDCKNKLHSGVIEQLRKFIFPKDLCLQSHNAEFFNITIGLDNACDQALLAKCLRLFHLQHEIKNNTLILLKTYRLNTGKLNKAFKYYESKLEKKICLESQRLEKLIQEEKNNEKIPATETLQSNNVVEVAENTLAKQAKVESKKGKKKISDEHVVPVPTDQKIKFNRYYAFKPNGAGKNQVYELNEGHIKSKDRKFVCVSKELLNKLDTEQQKRLYNLLQRSKQIGKSTGENGFIITQAGAGIKGKLCKKDYRFFGKKLNLNREVRDVNGKTCSLYELNKIQLKHK